MGVSWLLFEKAHWTLDVGHREQGFSPARGEQPFTDAVSRMVAHASERVRTYRESFATIQRAHRHYPSTELSGWNEHLSFRGLLAGDYGQKQNAEQT